MSSLKELRDERLRKLEELKKAGIDPYPANSHRTHSAAEVISDFEKMQDKQATLTGRITAIRKFGKIAFVVLKDASGEVQLFLKHDNFSSSEAKNSELEFGQINLLDSGDFLEAQGKVIKTQTGEISLEVSKIRLLTKSLRSLPTEQEGFNDKEQRLRRRYVDTNVNKDVFDRFIRRSKFWQATRDFLNKEGFLEINTPVLEHTTGGADANPFVTHMDALDQDFYLRISHELPLKRLIGGGYEKVYDIGPRFRNENYSDEHLPEHVAMEWYAAYWDWREGMKFQTELYRYTLQQTFGTLQFKLGSFEIDLSKDWEEWDYGETIKKRYGIDVYDCSLDEIKKALTDNKLEVEKTENKARGIDKLWKNIRKDVAGPIWLVNTPLFISPLSKSNPERPETTQRFQAVIAGSELGNGFSELNDPAEQLDRFVQQQKMRDQGDDEAMMLDIDYVEMLEYGIPPTCGWGHSERLFWIFEGVSAREGVVFPQMRTEVDETTKKIYPQVYDQKGRSISAGASREQDFSKRIVAVVDKSLEPWRATNAVAHMSAIIGNEIDKKKLTSGDYFVGEDGVAIPRNSQYPIIIMGADQKDLHKLYQKVTEKHLTHHVFIKEMQDTTNDEEIVATLKNQPITETNFYGISFFAGNELADELTKSFQLWK